MKALDKVFDTQVITGIIGDKFHFIEAKENFLYEEGKENRQEKDGIKATIVASIRQPTEFIKVSEWNIERCIKLQII